MFLDVPIVITLSIVVLMIEAIRQVWSRFGLSGVTYRRRLERDRIGWGDEILVTIEVWNRKRLPLAWLRADDAATPGVVVRERELALGRKGRRPSCATPGRWPRSSGCRAISASAPSGAACTSSARSS